MAIVARTLVEPADQAAHDRLQREVEVGISRLGGPADGLMVHLGYPAGQGFLIVDVFRSEDTLHGFLKGVMGPAITAAGLAAGATEICPVWSLARP